VRVWLELSGENPELARAELEALLERGGGRTIPDASWGGAGGRVAAELPTELGARELVGRMAFLRRAFRPWREEGLAALVAAFSNLATGAGAGATFDWPGGSAGRSESTRATLAAAFVRAGGHLDLARPDRRFRIVGNDPGSLRLAESLDLGDRGALARRRMPSLPFQRPVSLPPKFARAAANLAGIGPGDRVADPFVGTGALLLEAGLLGARLFGVDRDATMVRGALRNLAAFDLVPERLVVADAADAVASRPWPAIDAILTDPPYGRASSTGGEGTAALLERVLPRWARWVRPGGRIVVVVPGGEDPRLPPPWRLLSSVAHRVHRSLRREFRVYARVDQ
jgi:putative methyltransferase (TIGR01177 family)